MDVYLQHYSYVLQHYLHDSINEFVQYLHLVQPIQDYLQCPLVWQFPPQLSPVGDYHRGSCLICFKLWGLLPCCWYLSCLSLPPILYTLVWRVAYHLEHQFPRFCFLSCIGIWYKVLEFFSLGFGRVVLDANSLVASPFKLLEVFHDCVFGNAVLDGDKKRPGFVLARQVWRLLLTCLFLSQFWWGIMSGFIHPGSVSFFGWCKRCRASLGDYGWWHCSMTSIVRSANVTLLCVPPRGIGHHYQCPCSSLILGLSPVLPEHFFHVLITWYFPL